MSIEKKVALLKCISTDSPANTVINSLFEGGVPTYEAELWDYKLRIEDDAPSLAELCRDSLSFYNSYGGYLIFGVADGGILRGVDDFPFDEKRIKQKIRTYSGHDVVVRVESVEYEGCRLVCVSVPKRQTNSGVAVITSDGPAIKGKPIFRRGSVYFRADESSQLIRDSEDMRFLSSERVHPLDTVIASSTFVPHNLPDRMMICERFIGRSEVKQRLWLWLADRMSRYRVLAGPGGVGKTSAAYSFAEDVASSAPLGFMQVVWLSAKTKQFNASRDQFVRLAYSGTVSDSFSDFETLLNAIAEHLPLQDEEVNGAAEVDLVQALQEGLTHIPSFFVIDDLDSLSTDDQRRVVELAMLLGSEQVRFLLTTRKNYIAPLGSVTLLPGFESDDLDQFVRVLEERYQRKLTDREVAILKEETGGSPLFIESVFRLLKVGVKFADAISRWKGEDGEAVRAAAFRRELEQLNFKAKRALFAISQFDSLSSVEIRKIAELEQPQVEEALIELEQLFLLSSEQIGDEARFSVPPNIVRLLFDHRAEFVPSHAEIVRRAGRHREESKMQGKARGNSRYVGKVIAQAMAQVGPDPRAALTTIRSALEIEKASADLWMVYARCLLAAQPADIETIRKAFTKSYDLGKREKALLEKWIQFETSYGNSNAAVDVAEKGAAALVPPPWDWLVEAAAAYFKRGSERFSRLETNDAASDFRVAENLLTKALKFSPESAKSSVKDALKRASGSHSQARARSRGQGSTP